MTRPNSLWHPTAVIDPGASIEKQVEVGPFAVIGPGVSIDSGTSIGPHAVVETVSLYTSDAADE